MKPLIGDHCITPTAKYTHTDLLSLNKRPFTKPLIGDHCINWLVCPSLRIMLLRKQNNSRGSEATRHGGTSKKMEDNHNIRTHNLPTVLEEGRSKATRSEHTILTDPKNCSSDLILCQLNTKTIHIYVTRNLLQTIQNMLTQLLNIRGQQPLKKERLQTYEYLYLLISLTLIQDRVDMRLTPLMFNPPLKELGVTFPLNNPPDGKLMFLEAFLHTGLKHILSCTSMKLRTLLTRGENIRLY